MMRKVPNTLRRALLDWLSDMDLVQAGATAVLDRYIGYYEPYATSHEALDRNGGVQEEVRNVARALATRVKQLRKGKREPDAGLTDPHPK